MRLAADGARVAVIDVDESAAALTAKLAGEELPVVADASDSAAVDAALETVEAELGPVEVWVNNAGEEVTTALEATVRTRPAARSIGPRGGGTIVSPNGGFVTV